MTTSYRQGAFQEAPQIGQGKTRFAGPPQTRYQLDYGDPATKKGQYDVYAAGLASQSSKRVRQQKMLTSSHPTL